MRDSPHAFRGKAVGSGSNSEFHEQQLCTKGKSGGKGARDQKPGDMSAV